MKRLILSLVLAAGTVSAQSTFIDSSGTWRWLDSKEKISLFGINYVPMFAHSFRRMEQLGIDYKGAIRQDTYHFSRLGLDAYRVHIWETEFTDHEGNLIENEHLDLFDFTVAELQKRNIRIFLTPLGLLNNGYPDKASRTPGFQNIYDKQACSREPEAFTIQARYLTQLMEHVNPYTGVAYKDDPMLIGIELNNEPYHTGTPEQTKQYIETLIEALRGTGFKNPLFYNMSQNPYNREIYYSTDLDGFTFQWYPTGLGGGEPFRLNLLPYINEYALHTPQFNFGQETQFKKRARIIYEFGLSNTRSSYGYAPAARALREAGFQLAAYFSYDPMAIAAWNTEYPKHFMNLAHTPRSAIGLMIAAEVFRGTDGFSSNPFNDQSLLNNGRLYCYSNGTDTPPRSFQTLETIAGVGSSPAVQYSGTGAYFFDRLDENAWRLELMPDAIPLRNPFSYNPSERAVGIQWKRHTMQLNLPGLGSDFSVTPINSSGKIPAKAENGRFPVQPGIYLLGDYPAEKVSTDFFAPPPDENLPAAWNPESALPANVLLDGNGHARIFFSHGSKSKAAIDWGNKLSVTADADCYGWDPEFVQFGYTVDPPTQSCSTLKLKILSLHTDTFPLQVELGLNNAQVFGQLIQLKPGENEYEIDLRRLKPVALARHSANPSYLPALSTVDIPTERFDPTRIESLRFTIGPGLDAEQKKHQLGLHVSKAWLE